MTRFRVWTPRLNEAQDWLARAFTEIEEDVSGLHSSLVWRRWTPGTPKSQMMEHHTNWAKPLWKRPRRRKTAKESLPLWEQQLEAAHDFWQELQKYPGPPGGLGWLDDMGCLGWADFPPIRAQLAWKLKRIATLKAHLSRTDQRNAHLVPFWDAQQRPQCSVCGKFGYACRPTAFLNEECSKWKGAAAASQGEALGISLKTLRTQFEQQLDYLKAFRCE